MSITKATAYGKPVYVVRYRDVDSRKKQSKTFRKQKEAQDFDDAMKAAKRGGIRVVRQSTDTLRQFWTEYLEDYARHDLAAATVAAHEAAWTKWIEPELGDVKMSTLAGSPDLIQGLKLAMIVARAGEPTQRRVLAVLSAVLTKAVQLQRIVSNPVKVIKKPPVRRSRQIRVLNTEEAETLLEHFTNESDRRLGALLVYGGLRPQDALALEASDIGARAISITKAMKLDGVGNTKTNGHRMVPISAELRPYVTGLADGKVFADRDGKHWSSTKYRNWRTRKFQRACEKVGLATITKQDGKRTYDGPRPYDLRHTRLSQMLYKGTDPVRVAQIAGHSPAVLFSTYAHAIAETAPV
jgi:integrase